MLNPVKVSTCFVFRMVNSTKVRTVVQYRYCRRLKPKSSPFEKTDPKVKDGSLTTLLSSQKCHKVTEGCRLERSPFSRSRQGPDNCCTDKRWWCVTLRIKSKDRPNDLGEKLVWRLTLCRHQFIKLYNYLPTQIDKDKLRQTSSDTWNIYDA